MRLYLYCREYMSGYENSTLIEQCAELRCVNLELEFH